MCGASPEFRAMNYYELKSVCRVTVIWLFIVSFLLLTAGGHADLFFWTDENGVKHFSNDLPADGSGEVIKIEEYARGLDQEDLQENQKADDSQEIKPPGQQKEPIVLQKAVLRQKRTGKGPRVNINFKYYDFVSVNINDIIGIMWKKSPIRNEGISYCANANSRVKYNYYTNEEEGIWYIDRVYTTVDVTFTMPKWADYRKANRDQQQKWDAFYDKLMDHENGHKDIAIEAAKEIENELLKLNSTDGHVLKNDARSKARKIIKNSWDRQKIFDDQTGHGVKTGVVLR